MQWTRAHALVGGRLGRGGDFAPAAARRRGRGRRRAAVTARLICSVGAAVLVAKVVRRVRQDA